MKKLVSALIACAVIIGISEVWAEGDTECPWPSESTSLEGATADTAAGGVPGTTSSRCAPGFDDCNDGGNGDGNGGGGGGNGNGGGGNGNGGGGNGGNGGDCRPVSNAGCSAIKLKPGCTCSECECPQDVNWPGQCIEITC